MNDKLKNYLDAIFSPYENNPQVRELKEELYNDLQEKLNDLKQEGYEEAEAYHMTIETIGEINDLVETIQIKTNELQQKIGMDFSKSNLKHSDLRSSNLQDGKFNYCDLQGSDFSLSNLTNSSFKCSNLDKSKFDGANLTRSIFNKSNLKGASFANCILDHTSFLMSELSGVCFDHLVFNGTVFDNSGLRGASFRHAIFRNVSFKTDVKKVNFDGATMDKMTYAILKGYKADLKNVTVV
ncbi:pentapeptide repeat-containing protein [Paenibacillus piri]|uniref:Pentapeptide repeat-containing protein n=1 Tax=Paenibacillus piri TaxID=2547395 RepID=A0A4R5KJS3_9BACL|nr:pentapeptide repeat-containing protein [Paenibacillus piri]TDF95078.1 pentapeptide repeat-containing protein [Paenibacillus piri]